MHIISLGLARSKPRSCCVFSSTYQERNHEEITKKSASLLKELHHQQVGCLYEMKGMPFPHERAHVAHLYRLRCTANHESITALTASPRRCRQLHCTPSYKPGGGIPSPTQLRSISIIVCKRRKQLQAPSFAQKFRSTLADIDMQRREHQQISEEMSPAGAGHDEF